MQNLLNVIESLPIWAKILIPFFLSVVCNLIFVIIKYGTKNVTIIDDIKTGIKLVFTGLVLYIAFIIIVGIAQLVLNMWNIHIWSFVTNHIWTLFSVFIVCMYIYVAFFPKKHKSTNFSYRPSSPNKKPKNSETKSNVKPVVVPIIKSRTNEKLDSIAPSNMTDVENKLRNGIDVKLDFDKTYSKISEALRIIKHSGAKITFCNIKNPKQGGTFGNMKRIASQAPGLIIYDIVIEAGFEAKELAASGACFTCDCSNRSSIIPDIAKAAKENKGYVMFVKFNKLDSSVLNKIRELGGYNIEFQ